MDLKKIEYWEIQLTSKESEYTSWLSTLPDIQKHSENKSRHCTLLEGLVLDLQVMQADLFGLQGGLSNIAKDLRVLEAWVSEQSLQTLEPTEGSI